MPEGHEKQIDEGGYLKCPANNCKVKEDGKWIILDGGKSKKYKYPRPENLVLSPGEEFNEGDIVGTAYNTTSPIIKLNATVKLMRAKASDGVRYFEKDNVIISDCYAYEEGTIEYKENQRGDIEVWIGNRQYDYNPKCMYYYPSGTKIKRFQRFCNGVENMGHVVNDLMGNLRDIYIIFRDQFYTLQDGGFASKHIVTGSVQEELVEMLFISLINVQYNDDKSKIENIDFLGTQGGVMNTGSFYTMLSYGHSSKVVSKALKGEINMKDDVIIINCPKFKMILNLESYKLLKISEYTLKPAA